MSSETAIRKAMPQVRQIRLEEDGGDLVLTYRQREWPTGCFLLLWLTGWTAGCCAVVGQAIREPRFFTILACAPFLASWFFVAGLLLWMFFGAEQVRLSPEGLEWRMAALVPFCRRRVPRAELKGVRVGEAVRRMNSKSTKGGKEPCLTFDTLGQPINFALGIDPEEQHWLVEKLNEYLDAVGARGVPARNYPVRAASITPAPGEILRPAAVPAEPLADSRIALRQEPQAVEFVWRGRWSPGALTTLTLINAFWNGVVGLSLCKQVEAINWGMFFFMIPHQVAGLVMGFVWLMTLTAPAWHLRWTFREGEARKRLSVSDEGAVVCDLGWSRRFAVRPPVRIVLQRDEKEGRQGSLWELMSHPDGVYVLSFLGEEDRELLRIDRLNEGDARWMADVLLRAFPAWSRREEEVICGAEGRVGGSPDERVS